MNNGYYWTERDTVRREHERMFRDEILVELYHNAVFSVYRCGNCFYAASDHRSKNGYTAIYRATPEQITSLVKDHDQWNLFVMRSEENQGEILLDKDAYTRLFAMRKEENYLDDAFEAFLKEQDEIQQKIFEQEAIIGTQEWRRRIEREVTANVTAEKQRYMALPWYKKLLVQPSVRKSLKNVNDQIARTQNRLVLEEMKKTQHINEGAVSPKTVKAIIVSVCGIAGFYLFLMLRLLTLQFVPALAGAIGGYIILTGDNNADTRNMNVRLIAWTTTVLSLLLGVIAITSMLR